MIDPGQAAPDFTLPDQSGRAVTLSRLRGQPVVLYFYPRDETPGCTAEACAFQAALPGFRDAVVVGVSPDDEASHARFARRHGLEFTLLADVPGPDGVPPVCTLYGTWQEKSLYGRRSMGVARTTYLIDAAGTVVQRWDRVKVPGHDGAVLEALKALRGTPC